ncbi:hypothetical protein N1031_07640 [Herbiconiux moechotypicola]|uniref:Peptidase S74 domain-containing protein n=1 Tax=Herbiconiux moechotypicola TaxID=637393 RepID=A0ABN3DHH9_9MICO|nr:hypothetical protein [Herbiconiux moechotypicola]MCS5729630.1 hypothetical protein [Herbiconiux moechotypicola]
MSDSQQPVLDSTALDSPEAERRFPRRLLFAGAAAGVAATAAAVGSAEPAAAASATTPWMLGGNSGVTTNNFIGPTTSGAALIFKTKANTSSDVNEKMRLSPQGRLGLGVTAPAARVDAISSSIGVQGVCSASASAGRGVVGSAPGGYGVEGKSTNNVGVNATGGYAGVTAKGTTYGVLASTNGSGISGYFTSASIGALGSGTTYGVYGSSSSVGVYGYGMTNGVYGNNPNTTGTAVYGRGGQYGVAGADGSTAGVRGDSGYVGVWGQATTYGTYGLATGTSGQNYGLFGETRSPDGYAVYANGRMHVQGTLSKSAGSFRIDHPQDPQNKWLSHSFVESPDMMNVYNGNVTTDAKGKATVTLPGYFEALNRDFRYQLTVLGQFAQAMISKKIAKNSFEIATDKPGVEVSWQVTGIRQDSYATANPIVVEQDKTAAEKGTTVSNARGTAAAAPFSPPTADELQLPPEPQPVPAPTPRPTVKSAPTTAP